LLAHATSVRRFDPDWARSSQLPIFPPPSPRARSQEQHGTTPRLPSPAPPFSSPCPSLPLHSLDENGTIPTNSLCPALLYGSGTHPWGGRLGPPPTDGPLGPGPEYSGTPKASPSRRLGFGLFANLTSSGRSAPGSVMAPLREAMAALASSRVAYLERGRRGRGRECGCGAAGREQDGLGAGERPRSLGWRPARAGDAGWLLVVHAEMALPEATTLLPPLLGLPSPFPLQPHLQLFGAPIPRHFLSIPHPSSPRIPPNSSATLAIAAAASTLAHRTKAYCARSPLAYGWSEMCTTSPCARKTAAMSSSVAVRGMLETNSLRSFGRMASASLTTIGLLSWEGGRATAQGKAGVSCGRERGGLGAATRGGGGGEGALQPVGVWVGRREAEREEEEAKGHKLCGEGGRGRRGRKMREN
jgi:hypothetical protein